MELKPALKSRRFNELVGLLLLFLGLITLLALISYDASDPTWFHRQQEGVSSQNWTGRVGATLAEALLQLLGVAAFLLPVVLGFVGWNRFRGHSVVASYGRFLGHVGLVKGELAQAAVGLGRLGGRVRVDLGHHDTHPLLQQRVQRGSTDALAATGDDGDLACEARGHGPLLPC